MGGEKIIDRLLHEGWVSELVEERNYGIIKTTNGLEVYFHKDSIKSGVYRLLTPGTPVRFKAVPNILGPQATTVELASPPKNETRH